MPKQYYSPQQLVDLIYYVVLQSKKPMTRLEICRAIGRAKSPHVLRVLDHMTADGWINMSIGMDNVGHIAFVYVVGKSIPTVEADNLDRSG